MRLALVIALLMSGLAPARADLRAGVSVVDITPLSPTPLGGYGARQGKLMQGVHDRIHAKALVLDDGRTRLAIITTDLIGSDLPMQRALAQALHLPPENVMLCASHTHSGPGALADNVFIAAMGPYSADFHRWMQTQLEQAARQAAASLKPARLGISISELTGHSRNRRRDETLLDPQLTVLRVDRRDGSPLAILVNFAAHGTTLGADNMLISADWMGAMQRELEASLGRGVVAMYANGAEGDQSPSPPAPPPGTTVGSSDTFSRCNVMGASVARAARAAYERIKPRRDVKLRTVGADLTLPTSAKSLLLKKGSSFVQIMRIGDVALVGLPGEVTAELGIGIKDAVKEATGLAPVAMGLANDHLGYILTEAQFARGGYEVDVSFYGSQFGTHLRDAVVELARRLGKD